MLHSDLQTERDARDMMDADPIDMTDEERGIPPDVAKILQRTDGELARLHKRLAAEFQFPDFGPEDRFVAVPMPGTSAANIDDRYPE
jgi:hypothetical protein